MVSTRRRKRQASLKSDIMKKVKSPRPIKNWPKIASPHARNLVKNRGKVVKKRAVLNSSNTARSPTKKHKAIKSIGPATPKKNTKTATKTTNGATPRNTKKRGISKPSSPQVLPKPSNSAVTPQTSLSTSQTTGKNKRVVFNREKLQKLLHRVAQSPNFGNVPRNVQNGNGNQLPGSVTRAAATVAPNNRFSLNENQPPPPKSIRTSGRPGQVASQSVIPAEISLTHPNAPILKRKNARGKMAKSSPVSSSSKHAASFVNGDNGPGVRDGILKRSPPAGASTSKEQMLQSLNLVRAKNGKMQAGAAVEAVTNQNTSTPVTSVPSVAVQLSASALKEKIKARLNATSNWNLTPITLPATIVQKPTLTPSSVEAVNSQLLKRKIAERLKAVQAAKQTVSPASVQFVGLANGVANSQMASPIVSSSAQTFDLFVSKPIAVGQNQPRSSRVLRWRERSLSRGQAKKNGSDAPASPKKAPPPPLMTRIDIAPARLDTTFTATRPAPKKVTGLVKPVLSAAALRQKLQARLITAAGAVKPNVVGASPGATVSPVATTSFGHNALGLGALQHPIKPINLRAKVMEKLSVKSPVPQASQTDCGNRGRNLFGASYQTPPPPPTNATPNSVVKSIAVKETRSRAAKSKKDVATTTPSQQSKRRATSTSVGSSSARPGTNPLGERMMDRLKGARFRHINENLYTKSGADAVKFFADDPEAFQAYHEGYQSQMSKWPIHPLDLIIKNIKKMPESVVIADFGCGDARLARSVPQKVHSFDLIALNKDVVACNMENVPLPDESVNMVVFCLSLMGTSLTAYLKEANRILKKGGLLKIAEIESRFTDVVRFLGQLRDLGFSHLSTDKNHKMFIIMNCVKIKNCPLKAKTNVVLKPCLYKRR